MLTTVKHKQRNSRKRLGCKSRMRKAHKTRRFKEKRTRKQRGGDGNKNSSPRLTPRSSLRGQSAYFEPAPTGWRKFFRLPRIPHEGDTGDDETIREKIEQNRMSELMKLNLGEFGKQNEKKRKRDYKKKLDELLTKLYRQRLIATKEAAVEEEQERQEAAVKEEQERQEAAVQEEQKRQAKNKEREIEQEVMKALSTERQKIEQRALAARAREAAEQSKREAEEEAEEKFSDEELAESAVRTPKPSFNISPRESFAESSSAAVDQNGERRPRFSNAESIASNATNARSLSFNSMESPRSSFNSNQEAEDPRLKRRGPTDVSKYYPTNVGQEKAERITENTPNKTQIVNQTSNNQQPPEKSLVQRMRNFWSPPRPPYEAIKSKGGRSTRRLRNKRRN